MDLLRLEYDIQHHILLSRKNLRDHAIIRLIVATLSTPDELLNLKKKDFRKVKGKDFEFYTVKLKSARGVRISPVDEKTYKIIMSLNDGVLNLTREEIDSIVKKYSPSDRSYNAESLRNAVIKILRDSSFFEIEFESIKDVETLYAFMLDFNPLYSGVWDEDEECIEDFILNYSMLTGIRDVNRIAEDLCEDSKKVERALKSGRRGLLSYI